MKTNVLYYGDNLHILRDYIQDESVDLIYLDPPFNSNRSYNVLFKEETGAASPAQIEAFEDTWNWAGAAESYDEIIRGPHQDVARILKALVEGLGHNEVTAYLTMMGIRLVELRRVLKPTGSIYLHCDPTASHYLKVLMDAVFKPQNFVNEIIWKRTSAHSDARQGSKHFGRTHDVILHYGEASRTWNPQFVPYEQEYVDTYYKFVDESGRRYWKDNLTAAKPGGDTSYEWKGVRPPRGRYWAYSRANMERLEKEGRIVYSRTGTPMYKRYLDEMPGRSVQDIWDDIRGLGGLGGRKEERLGYATQKPLALLERIITGSTNPDDVVLDPFCGCGTAVHAAQKLGRRWIGIDVTHLAIGLVRRRMRDAFPGVQIDVVGEPTDLPGARDLASQDKHQFQWWALDRIEGVPVAGKKKGADKGIDGVIPFLADGPDKYRRAIVSVKGGENVGVAMVRDLVGVLDRENEPVGILVTLAKPTREMITEAAAAGFYENEFWGKKYARVQVLTIEDILNGKRPDIPWGAAPFAKAGVEREKGQQERLV